MLAITGKKAEIICDEKRLRPEKSEVDRLLCDSSLARGLTGWRPQTSLDEGLKITADWVLKNRSILKSKIYNI